MRFLPLLVAVCHLVVLLCAATSSEAAATVPERIDTLHQHLAWVRGGSTTAAKKQEDGASDDDKNKKPQRQSTWGGFFGAPSPAPLDSSNKTASSSSKRQGLFGSKSKKQVNETKPETTLPVQQKDSKDKKKEKQKKQAKDKKAPQQQQDKEDKKEEDKKDKTKKKKPQEPSKDDSNTTSSDSASIIVLGGAPPGSSSSSGIRVIRATPPPPMRTGTGPGGVPGSPQDKSLMVAELITAVVRLGVRLWLFAWMRGYFSEHETIRPIQRFVWERINDRYSRDAVVLQHVLSDPPLGVPRFWWRLFHNWRVLEQNIEVPTLPLQERFNRTVVVVPLQSSDGGGELNLQFLRDVVSFLLQQYRARAFGVGRHDGEALPLEVVLLVSSPGGSVTHYGLAAAQVKRLADEEGLTLTVCVDKIAASGGYMIASQAHKILSAPLATLGSVGVIFEGLNFRDLAREYGIQPIVLKAGKYKNPTSTLFGPVSQADEKYENERLAKIHEAFQDLVVSSRPELKDQKGLLEGQVYLGSEALDLNLVDELKTSDEYIMERVAAGDRVLKLHQSNQRSMQRRLYHLSPLDLLPHLRTWVAKHATSQNLTSLLIAIGPAWGFAQHLIQQIYASRFSPSQNDD